MSESEFTLLKYSDEHQGLWNYVVRESKNGNFLHSRSYMDYHAHKFDEQSVFVMKHNKPIAIFPCNRLNEKIVSHGGLTYGGLIYGRKLHAVDVLEVIQQLGLYFKKIGASKFCIKRYRIFFIPILLRKIFTR